MKNIINKLKPIFLLLSLTIVCIAFVIIINLFKKEPIKMNIENNEALHVQYIKEYDSINTLQPEKIGELVLIEKASTSQGSVLAASSSCGNAIDILSETMCYKSGSGNLDYELGGIRMGTKVRKDSEIVLVSVTVPLELFSGMEVADSNRKITTETPTYKAAGEQIDDLSANVALPPRKQIDTYKDSSEDTPFTTDYSVGRGSSADAEISEEGKIGVNSKLPNQCEGEKYNNKSNVTPTKSNGRSELMVGQYRYPNEQVKPETTDIQVCDESKDKFIEWDTDLDGCHTKIFARALAFFQTIGDAKWNDCLNDADSCIYAEDIVLIMASPFGSTKDCYENGVCTNAYMNKRNSIVTPPTTKASGKTYYTTPCEVAIEGKNFQVKCAWDMTHLYRELEVNKFDDAPNVESTPSPAAYNNFLQNEIKGRRDGLEMPL